MRSVSPGQSFISEFSREIFLLFQRRLALERPAKFSTHLNKARRQPTFFQQILAPNPLKMVIRIIIRRLYSHRQRRLPYRHAPRRQIFARFFALAVQKSVEQV